MTIQIGKLEKPQQVGKLGEQLVIAELLKRGLDVYLPIVDIHGIDAIIRTERGKYLDIQIKTRDKITRHRELIDVRKLDARENLFIIAYFLKDDRYWIFPSKVFKENARYNKRLDRHRLTLTKKNKEKLAQYKDNFSPLVILKNGKAQFEAIFRRRRGVVELF